MQEEGSAFEAALAEAQALGYAEADPTFDIGGMDAAHKLALLTSLAFGTRVAIDEIHCEGIEHIRRADIEAADELGYRIKLLGVAQRTESGIEARVNPVLVPKDSAIGEVSGVTNAIEIEGDYRRRSAAGRARRRREGDGVVGDLRYRRGRARRLPEAVHHAGRQAASAHKKATLGAHKGAYYVRLLVHDRPGAMASIAGRMAEHEVSLESIVQRRPRKVDPAAAPKAAASNTMQLVLITHDTVEASIRRALKLIEQDGKIAGPRTDDPDREALVLPMVSGPSGSDTMTRLGVTPQLPLSVPGLRPGGADTIWRSCTCPTRTKTDGLDRVLVLEVARVTEVAAIAAARWRGKGQNKAADKAAVDAMRQELGRVHIRGKVVIGEGEMDEAPMLYIGEEVGVGDGPKVDIAVDPLEGTTICAKDMPNALAVLAISEAGGMLHAPDIYMDKIAIGPGYPAGTINLDDSAVQERRAARQGQGRAGSRDHGVRARPAAPREADRGVALDRRGRAPHPRRRHRRRDLDHRSRADRRRHLSGLGRRAGRRAGGCRAEVHRRADPGPACCRRTTSR